jgi:hypothetical protein
MADSKIIDLDKPEHAIANLRDILKHDDGSMPDAVGLCGCLAWATVQRTGGATMRERVEGAIRTLEGRK